MAVSGQRPKPTALKLVTGHGHRPLPQDEPEDVGSLLKHFELDEPSSSYGF